MAEDNAKDEGAVEKQPQAPAKKNSNMGIIIGLVVVILLLGGGGFYFYTTMNAADALPEDEEEPEITETNIYFSGFETNIVNLAESGESEYMYLKYGFDVELIKDSVGSEIAVRLPRLTSLIAGVMSNREWCEIATAQGRDRLARELMSELNDALVTPEEEESEEGPVDKIIGLYFTTFVAQ